jgi:hypothetical protein
MTQCPTCRRYAEDSEWGDRWHHQQFGCWPDGEED